MSVVCPNPKSCAFVCVVHDLSSHFSTPVSPIIILSSLLFLSYFSLTLSFTESDCGRKQKFAEIHQALIRLKLIITYRLLVKDSYSFFCPAWHPEGHTDLSCFKDIFTVPLGSWSRSVKTPFGLLLCSFKAFPI